MGTCYYASTPTRVPKKPTRSWIGWSRMWSSNNFCVCYKWERYGTAAANLINILSLYCDAVKPKFRRDRDVGSCGSLVRFYFQNLLTFWYSFFKNTLESSCQCQRDVCIHYDVSLYQRIDGMTCMFINKARARDWIVDMHELTQYPYTVQRFNPVSSNVWRGFKPRVLLVHNLLFWRFVLPGGDVSGPLSYRPTGWWLYLPCPYAAPDRVPLSRWSKFCWHIAETTFSVVPWNSNSSLTFAPPTSFFSILLRFLIKFKQKNLCFLRIQPSKM